MTRDTKYKLTKWRKSYLIANIEIITKSFQRVASSKSFRPACCLPSKVGLLFLLHIQLKIIFSFNCNDKDFQRIQLYCIFYKYYISSTTDYCKMVLSSFLASISIILGHDNKNIAKFIVTNHLSC